MHVYTETFDMLVVTTFLRAEFETYGAREGTYYEKNYCGSRANVEFYVRT